METWQILRSITYQHGYQKLANLLQISIRQFYNYLEGNSEIKASKLREIFIHTKDTTAINKFLSGTDHIAIKTKLELNGKWEDELKQIVVNLSDAVKAIEKKQYREAEKKLNNIINLVAQWLKEIEKK